MKVVIMGAVAGAVGTVAMTCCMVGMKHLMRPPVKVPIPPVQITKGLLSKEFRWDQLTRATQVTAVSALHSSYGVTHGIAYASLAGNKLKERNVAIPLGCAYGVFLWLSDYFLIAPKLNLAPAEPDQPKNFIELNLISHMVWGLFTGLTATVMAERLN